MAFSSSKSPSRSILQALVRKTVACFCDIGLLSASTECNYPKSNQIKTSRMNRMILRWCPVSKSCTSSKSNQKFPPRKNGTTQRPNFRCILQHFHGVVSRPRDTTRSALWKKRLAGFKVLRLPRKNVLHAPGCDKMAILDHGEVLPQTLLHARRCGKTQILQDFELPHSKNFINV